MFNTYDMLPNALFLMLPLLVGVLIVDLFRSFGINTPVFIHEIL